MRMLVFATLFALAACTGAPGIQVHTVPVPVIELRHCIDDVVATPDDLERPLPTDARDLSAILTAKLLEWAQYGRESQAAMLRCAGDSGIE